MIQKDNESYIFPGNEQSLWIYACWIDAPSWMLRVSCSYSYCPLRDSIAYLRMKICEAMESYPMFAGLTSLQVQDLKVHGQTVQDTDQIETFAEKTLLFSLKSSDLWLSISLDCYEIPVSISFELRTHKSSRINCVKEGIKNIANELLDIYNIYSYHLEEIQVQKDLEDVHSDQVVGDTFDYLDNCLHAQAKKSTEIVTHMINGPELEQSFIQNANNFGSYIPIRHFEVTRKKIFRKEIPSSSCNIFCTKCLIM